MNIRLSVELILLLLVANGTPVLMALLLGSRWSMPLDGGHVCRDGHRLLGAAKTVRGLLVSILATTLAATALGFTWLYGASFAGLAMLGDAASSFIKRRMGYPASCAKPVLDQVPETLLPLLVLQPVTGAAAAEIMGAMIVFSILDLLLPRLVNSGQTRCR